jgi:single-stranded DNA-binding protein
LETSSYEKEETMHYVMQLIAEKVTFLSNRKESKESKELKDEEAE